MSRDSRTRILKELDRKWARKRRVAKIKRFLGVRPMQYKRIPVPDWNERTRMLSAFRQAYAEFFKEGPYRENSALQQRSTQLFWHRMYLQKRRMCHLGVSMTMESQRVQRSERPKDSVITNPAFDGRYEVSEVNEAIAVTRTFLQNGRELRTIRDFDSIEYSILSAKQVGDDRIVCPNCGNVTTRENLIDGCDYCNTKFTVEDLADRINSFRIVPEVIFKDLYLEVRQANIGWTEETGAMVRAHDPNFSMRSFRASVFNKVAAIHFAETDEEISAFSTTDLSALREQYKNVVYIDFRDLVMFDKRRSIEAGLVDKNTFYVEDGRQHIDCTVHLGLFELTGETIRLRMETVHLHLQKDAGCKTQNICGPSVFTCQGCGTSLSLMEGMTCPYCGRRLDMEKHDWVITKYDNILGEPGKSWRDFD